jgi:CxxC motif-containing protein
MDVQLQGDAVLQVTGNQCGRGLQYAKQEAVLPMRVLTGLMRTAGTGRHFPVRTDRPVPRARLLDCARELRRQRPADAFDAGDIVIKDICGTGANVVVTKKAQEN